jgi:hypothetical protein
MLGCVGLAGHAQIQALQHTPASMLNTYRGLDIFRIWKHTAQTIRDAKSEDEWELLCRFVVFAGDCVEAVRLVTALQLETQEHVHSRKMACALTGSSRLHKSLCHPMKVAHTGQPNAVCIFRFIETSFKIERRDEEEDSGRGGFWVSFELAYPVHVEIVRRILAKRGLWSMASSLHLHMDERKNPRVHIRHDDDYGDWDGLFEDIEVPELVKSAGNNKREQADDDRTARCKTSQGQRRRR